MPKADEIVVSEKLSRIIQNEISLVINYFWRERAVEIFNPRHDELRFEFQRIAADEIVAKLRLLGYLHALSPAAAHEAATRT